MLYQKIGEQKYPIDKFTTFATQMGQTAVRIIGGTPTAENGFEIVDDADNVIGDMSEFTYLYREDENVKEYTKESEEIIPTQSFASGDIPITPYDVLSRRISAVNNRVTEITPYTESKEAGIQDKECVFDGQYKDGIISATVITSRGEQIPCTVEKSADSITVKFDELTDVATVTVSIQ